MLFRHLLGLLVAVPCALAVAQSPEPPPLHARFSLAAGLDWAEVDLDAASWRIGSADGRPASPAEVVAALAGAGSLQVGGRCAGWVEGPTSNPCGFAVEASGRDGARFVASTVGWEPSAAMRAVSANNATPEIRAAGLIAPMLDRPQYVGVRLPLPALGAERTGHLRFRIRAVSNPLVPSVFDRASGEAILQPRAGAGELPG